MCPFFVIIKLIEEGCSMEAINGKLSVLVAFHNQATIVPQTLGRLLTFDEIGEIIALDCQSDDDTRQCLFNYSDKDDRIQVHHAETTDIFEAFNIGLSRVTRPYVQFLRADEQVEILSQAIALLSQDTVDMVISGTQSQGLSTTLAYHPELLEDIQLSNIIYKKHLIDTFKLNFYSGKEGVYLFNAMAMMASQGISLLPKRITKPSQNLPWYHQLSEEEWQRFLMSNTWLLKAAQPVPEIYHALVYFILTHAMDYGFPSKAKVNQNIKNAKYFVKWLKQEEIDYTEYALSAHLQLKYQALMTGAFPRFIALLTQNDEKIVYNQNKYQPKLSWHCDLIPEKIYLKGKFELIGHVATQWRGHITLEDDLPLVHPKLEAVMIHSLSGQKVPVMSMIQDNQVQVSVDSQLLDRFGEWQLQLRLQAQNAVVELEPTSNEQPLFFYDEAGRFVGRYSHQLSLYIQAPVAIRSFQRIEWTEESLTLSTQLEDGENLALYHKKSGQWLLSKRVKMMGQNVQSFNRKMLLSGEYEIYVCTKDGIRPLSELQGQRIDEMISDGAYQYHFKMDRRTTLEISILNTKGEIVEDNEQLRVKVFTKPYENLGYTPVALIVNGKRNYRFSIDKANIASLSLETLESGRYICEVLYQNGKEIILSPLDVPQVEMDQIQCVTATPFVFEIQHLSLDKQINVNHHWIDYIIYRLCPLIDKQVLIHTKQKSLLLPLVNPLYEKGYKVLWSDELTNHQKSQAFARSAIIISDTLFSTQFGKHKGQVMVHLSTTPFVLEMDQITQSFKLMKQKLHKKWLHHIQQFDTWYVENESEKNKLQAQWQYSKASVFSPSLMSVALSQQPQLERGTLSVGLLIKEDVDFKQLDALRGKVTFYVLQDEAADGIWRVSVDNIEQMAQKVSMIITDQIDYYELFKTANRTVWRYRGECELVNALQQKVTTACFPYNQEQVAHQLVEHITTLPIKQMKNESIVIKPLLQQVIHKTYETLFAMVGKLPSTNTMVFESFYGKKYADNPKALYLYAKEHYPEYRLVWTVQKGFEQCFEESGVPYIVANSLKALWIQARAKYWIQNTRMVPWKKPPAHTTVLQTWHGTPWKRLGLDIEHVTMPGVTKEEYHAEFLADTKKWDYLIAPNAYSLNIFRSAFDMDTMQMLPTGYPRNDVLVNATKKDYADFKMKLNLPRHKKVVLYAPTWRDDDNRGQGQYEMNLALDIKQFKERFGDEAVLLIRSHYFIKHADINEDEGIIDVSNYQDISDLYLASDVLITDYSSAFFDYALLKKPMIFFAYDKETYCDETRGFYFDYETVPGPIVQTNNELMDVLEEALHHPKVDEKYQAFAKQYLAWEDGRASQHVFEMLFGEKKWHIEEQETQVTGAVVKGEPILRNPKKSIQLKGYNGHSIEVERTYCTIDPIHQHPEGPAMYQVRLNDKVGYLLEEEILSDQILDDSK